MARGINKVILIGNLGADPEIRSTSGGLQVANLRLATSESWRDKQSGQMTDRTEWHRVVLFGRLAEIAQQYLKKGQQIYIEGRIQTRKWQDKQSGQDRYSTEIVGNEMQMLGGRGAGADMGGASRGGDAYPADDYGSGSSYGSASASSYANASGGSVSHGGGGPSETREEFDDDIPF